MSIPDYAIERLARCMLPLIKKYYESEEGQKELQCWDNTNKHFKTGLITKKQEHE